MNDRQQIQDQLAQRQSELATINADLDDPQQACANYGLDGDFCAVFTRNLRKEALQAQEAIIALQENLRIYDLLDGRKDDTVTTI